jgi:hypothetical protein
MVANQKDEDREVYAATWALLSSRPFTSPEINKAAEDLLYRPDLRTWTDDYNNLFQILNRATSSHRRHNKASQ